MGPEGRLVPLLADWGWSGFNDAKRLRREPDLGPRRSREDFRLILMDLSLPTDPFMN